MRAITRRLVVEVDGVHHEVELEQRAHDARRDAVLEREGFAILRFTNGEVRWELEMVLRTIRGVGEGRG